VPRPPTSRRFTLTPPELDEIAERDATSPASPAFDFEDDRELSSQTILFEVACICDDFPASHQHGTGPCMGWCDQTCQAYRPVLLDRTSPAWEALLAEACRVAWPEHFACDLFRDWQLLTQDNAPDAFVWALRRLGTICCPLTTAMWPCRLCSPHTIRRRSGTSGAAGVCRWLRRRKPAAAWRRATVANLVIEVASAVRAENP
jgi:hypothetical protein